MCIDDGISNITILHRIIRPLEFYFFAVKKYLRNFPFLTKHQADTTKQSPSINVLLSNFSWYVITSHSSVITPINNFLPIDNNGNVMKLITTTRDLIYLSLFMISDKYARVMKIAVLAICHFSNSDGKKLERKLYKWQSTHTPTTLSK